MTTAQKNLMSALVADGHDETFARKAVEWFAECPTRKILKSGQAVAVRFINDNEHLIRNP